MANNGTEKPAEDKSMRDRLREIWEQIKLLPSKMVFLHDVAKWMQTIATIGAVVVLAIYLTWSDAGRFLNRLINVERHWFYVGTYDPSKKPGDRWISTKQNGEKKKATTRVESGAGVLVYKFEDGWWLWDESFMHGEVVVASNLSGAVGRTKPDHDDSKVSGHAERLKECIYIQDSYIDYEKSPGHKEVWIYGIVWDC